MSKLIFPFIKNKSGFKLEDKLPISSSCDRRSAWSYSYDLNLNQIREEALQKATESECTETEVEDKSINFEEDLEDDFIFQGGVQIHEFDATDRLRGPVMEDLKHSAQEDTLKHRIYKPGNNLESATLNEMEQCIDNVRGLRISNVPVEKSWLSRIIRPFEQLRIEYNREKMKWKKQVDFLKQRNSLLKSELQDVKRAYRKAAEQLSIFKTFYSQNQSVVGRNFDVDLDSQMMSVVSWKLTLSQQKYAVKKEHTDVKLECYKTNHPETDRNVIVNEKKINENKFLKVEKKPSRAGSPSLKQAFLQKPLPSKNILQDSKNKLVPDDSKKLKPGNTDFQKRLDMETRSLYEALPFSEKLKAVNPLVIKSPGEQHPPLNTTNCISNENSSRETCENFLKDCNSEWRRTALGDDRKYIMSTEKSSGDSLKVSRLKPSSHQLKEKLFPKTEFPKSNAQIFGYSWKHRKPEKSANTLNERVLKVDKKEIFLDLHKISRESAMRCFKHYRECEGSSKRLNRSPTGITIRSFWL